MIKSINSKSFMMLSVGAAVILLGSLVSTEGSSIKDAVQGFLMGAGAVIAVAGLWMAGSKK